MRIFLLLVVSVRSYEKICEFVYNNPDWKDHSSKEDTFFEDRVEKGKVTGIVTASFDIISPTCEYKQADHQIHDFLRFYTRGSGETFQSLVFKIRFSTDSGYTFFTILGKYENDEQIGVTEYVTGKAADIQISDQYSDSYKIYLGDPGDAASFNYNFGSEDNWNLFQNNKVRLQDTVRIKNDGRCTVFKYISVCSDPTPRLYDEQEPITQSVNLGSPYILTCAGSGAPYLDVKWSKNSEPTDIQSTNTYTVTEADHRIESTVTIGRVTSDHLGTWTCTILNKNFGNSVTKTCMLQPPYFVSLISSPPLDYYTANSEDTEFKWAVQGWPLDEVTLYCGGKGEVTRDELTYVACHFSRAKRAPAEEMRVDIPPPLLLRSD